MFFEGQAASAWRGSDVGGFHLGQVANSSGLGKKLGDAGLLGLGAEIDFLGDHFVGAGFVGAEETFNVGMVIGLVVEGEIFGAD